MEINTHPSIDPALCGTPVSVSAGKSIVRLETLPCMAADTLGLVHGGFVFGMADYAAMLAVNDPFVVLGAAETRFLKPVRVGEMLEATATLRETSGKKRSVEVTVCHDEICVFHGTFTCFVLEQHVLAPA